MENLGVIIVMLAVGVAILFLFYIALIVLTAQNEKENKIYRDAARERWQSKKKESL